MSLCFLLLKRTAINKCPSWFTLPRRAFVQFFDFQLVAVPFDFCACLSCLCTFLFQNLSMNILQSIFTDYYEHIIHELKPRRSIVQNTEHIFLNTFPPWISLNGLSFISRKNIPRYSAIMGFMPSTINRRKHYVNVPLLRNKNFSFSTWTGAAPFFCFSDTIH